MCLSHLFWFTLTAEVDKWNAMANKMKIGKCRVSWVVCLETE